MKTKNKTLVLDKVVEFDHFKYMRTKNKTLVLGGGYAGLSEGYGNVLIIGLMRTLSVNTAYPFVALIYENNNCKKYDTDKTMP